MNTKKQLRKELADLFYKNSDAIVTTWVSQLMRIPSYKANKNIVPAKKHKKSMIDFFKCYCAFLKNQRNRDALKCMSSFINKGHLSINSAEDVIRGQAILRILLADFILNIYKHNRQKLHYMIRVIVTTIDAITLHISSVYRKRDFNRLHTLVKSGKKLVDAKDLNRLLRTTINIAVKESGADRASIMLLNKKGVLRIAASVGIPADIVEKAQEKIGKGVAGRVAAANQLLIINEGQKAGKTIKKALKGLDIVSAVVIPISLDASNVLGILSLGKFPGKALFDREDAELLSLLAREVAISITRHQMLLATESLYMGTMFALANALDARDHYTHGHSRKVAKTAVVIAKGMKLPSHQIELVQRASLLHDIGKIGIPDKILNKPAKLTKGEIKIVETHPTVALNILKPIPQLKDILPIVYHEHEHYNGKGYVAGLKGKAIPLEARIIGVADAYDAMVSERPYRKPLPKKKALAELKKFSGTQFDPRVVNAFISTLKASQK